MFKSIDGAYFGQTFTANYLLEYGNEVSFKPYVPKIHGFVINRALSPVFPQEQSDINSLDLENS